MQKMRDSKLGRIVIGWYRRIFKIQSEMAKERLKICKPCSLNVFGQCAVCYCNLKAKAEIEEEKCEHPQGNKWYDGYFYKPPFKNQRADRSQPSLKF